MKVLVGAILILLSVAGVVQYQVSYELIKSLERTHAIAIENRGVRNHVAILSRNYADILQQTQELKKEIAENTSTQSALRVSAAMEVLKECDNRLADKEKKLIAMIKRRQEPSAK